MARTYLAGAVLAVAAVVALAPASAQDSATQLGWCRVDGINGGNVIRTRGATGCNFGAVLAAAREAAIEAAQGAAANSCPSPVNAANANSRCQSASSTFMPSASLDVRIQQIAGRTAAERAATHLTKVGGNSSGICTFARITAEREETDLSDRSCGFWPFRFSRRTVIVDARASCGVVCF